jgi:hypothetical protein
MCKYLHKRAGERKKEVSGQPTARAAYIGKGGPDVIASDREKK